MAVHFGFLLMGLVLLVPGAAGEGCTDLSALTAVAECATNFANTVGNLTLQQMADLKLFCGLISEYKMCLASACGGWENVPQQATDAIDQALLSAGLDCSSLDGQCENMMATIECGAESYDNLMAGQHGMTIKEYCNLVDDYKTCLSDACGSWSKVPDSIVELINNIQDQDGIKCDGSGASASLILTVCLSVAAFFFRG